MKLEVDTLKAVGLDICNEYRRSTYYSSNESKGSPLAHGRSDQIRLSDLIGCPIQRYGAADVSCGDGAVIRRVSGDQRIDPR
ncbi:hypothetical protein NDU88_011253 [Pleurodeles waltl]|uniref:Uncharacterized protein n=1 Tax=Pleurodeles waltl TaxID=8319 RepID=A0AAV7Q041_PLEWA|nr:hypothetical protein NDU88_011253 [Pleurodeles waltl]